MARRCRVVFHAVVWAGLLLISPNARAEDPVKIGVLNDMSGPYADVGGMGSVVALKMAIEDFGGTLFGKPIEVVYADHQNKADIAANIARQWYDRDKVDMITDLTNSAVAIAVQGIARERQKINLVTATATTVLTNEACSPWGVHWTFDAYALSVGTAAAMVAEGGRSWYFISADYAFGHNLEENAANIIRARGGTVVGRSRHPLNSSDFSTYLLHAQASGAQVIGLANTGSDFSNSVKQAKEFRIDQAQKLAGLSVFITDIHALGLETAAGLILTEAFYWDLNDETRAWSRRFQKLHGTMPTMIHAGTYSAALHYLSAVKAVGSKEPNAVMGQMRKTPINDVFWKNGKIRPDGVMEHDMLLLQVKSPKESREAWDYYSVVRTIPGKDAFEPLETSKCPLVKKQ